MSAMYDKARQAFAEGDLDFTGQTFKVSLIDTADYTVNLSTHDFMDDVPSGAIVATATLSNKSATNGVLDADDVTFSSVTGDSSEAVLLWMDTGTTATSRPVAYWDAGTGLPVTPNGGNINLAFDSGANKILKI